MKKYIYLITVVLVWSLLPGVMSAQAAEETILVAEAETELTGMEEAEVCEEDIRELLDETAMEIVAKIVEVADTSTEAAIRVKQEAIEEQEEQEAKEAKKEAKKEARKAKKKAEKKKNYTDEDVKLLACLIFAEAGNQPYQGKVAVGNVVMNRVKSELFPNTLHDVIYQQSYSKTYGRWIYQFSVAYPSVGTLEKALNNYGKRVKEWEIVAEAECIKAATAVLEGESAFAEGANYLFFCRYSSGLASRKPNGVRIEAHYFYR